MSCDSRWWSKTFLTEFLELYKENPALWKVESSEYKNRLLKNGAYGVMIKKLKEVDPNATRDSVKRKIDSIRGSYRKEAKKVKLSIKEGAVGDDIYKPKLWYYELLKFLEDKTVPGDKDAWHLYDESKDRVRNMYFYVH